ncbi:hypothetical protein GCM10009113_26090 [Marinobacter szutsaonensis]
MTGIDADAAVLVLLAVNEIGFVALGDEVVVFNLVSAHAVILNANHVSVLVGQPVKKALINSLGEAIDAD